MKEQTPANILLEALQDILASTGKQGTSLLPELRLLLDVGVKLTSAISEQAIEEQKPLSEVFSKSLITALKAMQLDLDIATRFAKSEALPKTSKPSRAIARRECSIPSPAQHHGTSDDQSDSLEVPGPGLVR